MIEYKFNNSNNDNHDLVYLIMCHYRNTLHSGTPVWYIKDLDILKMSIAYQNNAALNRRVSLLKTILLLLWLLVNVYQINTEQFWL